MKVVQMSSSKASNSAHWNAEQCLEELLADIRAGRAKPKHFMIMWMEETPEGRLKPRSWFVNVRPMEEVALLALAQHKAIEDWRDQ